MMKQKCSIWLMPSSTRGIMHWHSIHPQMRLTLESLKITWTKTLREYYKSGISTLDDVIIENILPTLEYTIVRDATQKVLDDDRGYQAQIVLENGELRSTADYTKNYRQLLQFVRAITH